MFRRLRTRLGSRVAALVFAMALIGGGAALAMPGVVESVGLAIAEERSPLDEVPPTQAFAEEETEEESDLEEETDGEIEALEDLEEGDGPPPEVVAFVDCVHEFARGQGDPATHVVGGHDCEKPAGPDDEESAASEESEDDGPPEGVGGPPDWAGPKEGVGGPPEGAGPPGR